MSSCDELNLKSYFRTVTLIAKINLAKHTKLT